MKLLKKTNVCGISIGALMILVIPFAANAQIEANFLKEMWITTQITTFYSGLSTSATLGGYAALITRVLLSLLGILFTLFIVYSGYLWLTAAGNTEQVEKGKKLLISAVIGMIIVVAGYVISFYILEFAVTATQGTELYYYEEIH